MDRRTVRTLLIQVRDAHDPMREHERACVERRIEPRNVRITTRNALHEEPSKRWLDDVDALIIGGSGDYSVHHPDSATWVTGLRRVLERALERKLPGFAICFGHQLLGQHLGAVVTTDEERAEIGTVDMRLTEAGRADGVFAHLDADFAAHTGHSDHVTSVPDGVELLASNERLHTQAFKVRAAPFYSTQFHPEMTGLEARSRYHAYRSSLTESLSPQTLAAMNRFRPGADATTSLLAQFIDTHLPHADPK